MYGLLSIDFTLAIVAGGKSSRMGVNKALAKLGNQSIIAHMIERTQHLGQSETILITNTPAEYQLLKLPMYPDVIPDKGSLGGIYSALRYSETAYTLVLACDMPFVNPDILQYLLTRCSSEFEVVVPYANNRLQGLHAIYHIGALPIIELAIKSNNLRVQSVLEQLKMHVIDESEIKPIDLELSSFLNVNTPDDLKVAQAIWDKLN